jgi:hypothetical protein
MTEIGLVKTQRWPATGPDWPMRMGTSLLAGVTCKEHLGYGSRPVKDRRMGRLGRRWMR